MSNFPTLIKAISTAPDKATLCYRYMDYAGDLFSSQHSSIYIEGVDGKADALEMKGIPDTFIDYYQQIGSNIDEITKYVKKYHIPIHEQVIFTEEAWKQSLLYTTGCGRIYDHQHIMVGPIIGFGQIIGTVHFARTSGTKAFTTHDLLQLSALCSHISVSLAVLEIKEVGRDVIEEVAEEGMNAPKDYPATQIVRLTPREKEISELVAKGYTNCVIGQTLWISENTVKQTLKRIFRKLNVSARAELVAKLKDMQNENSRIIP
jgi:DNA-binding CsgD family transcriptional regulator